MLGHDAPLLADARGVGLSLVASAMSAAMRARPLRRPVTHGYQQFGQTVQVKRKGVRMVTVDLQSQTKRSHVDNSVFWKSLWQRLPAVTFLPLSTLTCRYHRLTRLQGMWAALSPKSVLPRNGDSAPSADVRPPVSPSHGGGCMLLTHDCTCSGLHTKKHTQHFRGCRRPGPPSGANPPHQCMATLQRKCKRFPFPFNGF